MHIRVKDPSAYDTCRLTDFDGKLPKGVRAKYCRRRDNGEWETQAYVFSKINWTREKAVSWVGEHKQAGSLGQARFAYATRFEPYVKQGKRYVKIWNLDDSTCRNEWSVTSEARIQALKNFVSEHNLLLGPAELSDEHIIVEDPTLPHHGEWAVIGKPVDFQSNGTTYGIYEVTVDEAWDRIEKGELKNTSPSILIRAAHYDEDGSLKIEEFAWDHTLFVDQPAFPKAGVVATCEGPNPDACFLNGPSFGEALQAAYHSHGLRPDGQEPRQDVAPYSHQAGKGTEKKPNENPNGEPRMTDKKEDEKQGCSEIEEKLKAAQAEISDLKSKLGQAANGKEVTNKELQGKYEALLEWQNATIQAQLTEKAQAVAELEVRAGRLEQAKMAERIEALKKIGVVGLEAMQAAMSPLVEALEEAKPLKSAYEEDTAQASDLEEKVRQAMFGYKRDSKSIDKATGLGAIIA